jgi:hypothetical protein
MLNKSVRNSKWNFLVGYYEENYPISVDMFPYILQENIEIYELLEFPKCIFFIKVLLYLSW